MPVDTRQVAIDESILESYRALQEKGQPDVVTEFIDVFLNDVLERMDRLQAARQADSAQAIQAAAHALKGSSGSVGAVLLAGLCAQLEANARAGSTEDAAELILAVELEVARTREELERHRRP